MSAALEDYAQFPCDLCGSTDAVEVPHAREFTDDQPVHICVSCGFVYVKQRRSAHRIAEVWSEDIFGEGYTAATPAVAARLTYVAEFIDQSVGLRGKSVCEIGAGEGEFLRIARERYDAAPFGIEPSPANCKALEDGGVGAFCGTIEEYFAGDDAREGWADVVTILWTLENCQDCRAMLAGAHRLLRPGGYVVVATGSRLLVPFKKPLWAYLSTNRADTHSFRFSANTLQGLLTLSRFDPVHVNRYLDNDILCVVGERVEAPESTNWTRDDYLDVHSFFERWYAETALYYPAPS